MAHRLPVSGNKNCDRVHTWGYSWCSFNYLCFAIYPITRDLVESMKDVIGIFSEGYGSGKDSIATTLAFEFDYIIYGFSEVMKDTIYYELTRMRFPTLNMWLEYCEAHKYDQPDNEGFWVRRLLQGYGQFKRYKTPNFWVDKWEEELSNREYEKVVVPSVRFPNEALRIKDLGGLLVKVVRPGIVVDHDPSEISMNGWVPDYIIQNDGTLKELAEKVRGFMQDRDKIWPNLLVKEPSLTS